MKTFLTEAGTATTVQAICTGFRKPLKLLQNFQLFQNSNMSSKVSVSSPLKTSVTSRQKKSESNTQIKESQNRNRSSNITTRKTAADKSTAGSRTTYKSSYSKNKETASDLKSKISESSEGSVTSSVGSLTSSPKWSHIKKKFETSESVPNSKSSRALSSTVVESKKSVHSNRITKNTLSGNAENPSTIHRNKYLSNRKDIDKKNDVSVNKSETNSSSRISNDKLRSNSAHSKNETQKLTSRCASPKNSSLNIPAANTSALHSANSSRYLSGSINPVLKLTHSSKSGSPESTVKNSRSSSPNTSSCSSPTAKSCSPKTSLSNIPTDNSVNNPLKSSSDKAHDCSNITSKNADSTSNFTSSVLSRKNSQDIQINTVKEKQKFEDKPILTFNRLSQQPNKSEISSNNRTVRKSIISELDKTSSTALNSSKAVKVPKTKTTSLSNGINSKTQVLENVEKIKDLAKNSHQGSKTVWIKDTAGNWIKKADVDAKQVSSSKVASLRSKFMESGKEASIPLTKSSTTSNVPSSLVQSSRPLAKSNTTSSICDNVFLDDFNKKQSPKNTVKKDLSNDVEACVKPSSTANEEKESSSSKGNNDLKLSIVQRAVLSYEGNIALLSPETQKRLKLVTEKVQAQTDDDKILRSKTKSSAFSNVKNPHRSTNTPKVENSHSVLKKSNDQKSLGEPVLPARNFLNRYQHNKTAIANEQNSLCKDENRKNKQDLKQNDTRSTFLADISSNLNKKETKNFPNNIENSSAPKKTDSSSNNKSVTKLTMNFKVPSGQTDMKAHNQENDYVLQPNSSFLWRRCEVAPSELSKSSTASSVSLTSSDYRSYYDIENYYSSLELEIEKGSENSDEHIYIDSQESSSSGNYYASSVASTYQNFSKDKPPKGSHDEWTDLSDDDYRKHSVSSNQSSTLKRRKNKRHSSYRDSALNVTRSQNSQESRKQYLNDTISFTDSSDTLINDEVGNESAFDLSDVNHLYEPVYESLGNYLLNQDEENDENCSISLSPDEPENGDFMHCSLTSLESAGSSHQDKEEISKISETTDEKNAANKKTTNKISQLKRHLSWTKNDIRLELSSKFNKIKIKKNGRNSTEIGLKMQDSENANTSPKKKTFIKCILRQKSAGSIPIKRSPSPKKESALFYVHLTMGREKKRPFSDSVVTGEASKDNGEMTLKAKKQSDAEVSFSSAFKCNQQQPRVRKFATGHSIQRPKTPPPLPPVQAVKSSENELKEPKGNACDTNGDVDDSQFYSVLDEEFITTAHQKPPYENEVLKLIHADGKCRTSTSTSVESAYDESDAPSDRSSNSNLRKHSNELNLPLLQGFQTENLKSPFEEEPMYQFYQKDVQQRATLWYSVDGSESEFEDDTASKFSDKVYQSPKRPVLQSQLSAMDLVHGDGGQRRLWCEVPEVIESGILKTITPNDRKIQEAMFEVITSEASYLKSLNFLIEHFVQCSEFSGEYTDKHILDKRERHILFSDIQPVRDVSASLLNDLEKRWLKYIVLSDICDILYHHASKYFSVYVKYCSNQLYQERLLRELKDKRPEFVSVLKRLESNPVCQGLDMHSFLMLPMQRITRLPLLIDAIFRRLSVDSPIYESCKTALATVNKIVAECNEGACKMQRMEEMLVISQQIDFKACKDLGLLSASRWLVKKGDLVQLLMDNSSRRTFGRSSRWCKIHLYLFLFTDLLVVTRKKGDDSYSVIDYCPRNMLQVMPIDENTPPLALRLPSSYRNVFQLIMLNNRDGKTVEMLLSCLLESDRTRWMNAVLPAKSENPDEKIYEEWDCPQVQCTHAYNAQQPDELSLEEADVVNVFKKMSDGWFEGERIRDGIRGWFPSSHTVEIINSHVRARNLHQRYRLLMLSQTYLEKQYKAQVQQTKK